MNILSKLTGRTLTLESILATFNKTIENLTVLEEQNNSAITENKNEIAVLSQKIESIKETNTTLNAETLKAQAVRSKIKDLITA